MLQSLHVKNLALIRDTRIAFGEGLNILTGETGAGKSLLIGSLNLALGAKFDKDMVRKGAESALIELVFDADARVNEKLAELELEQNEDDSVYISRRMQSGKSVCRVNGEVVNARQVKEIAELLIDIHGQHEHQSLLKTAKHLEIVDAFAGETITDALREVADLYHKCKEIQDALQKETMDETTKAKEQALAEFEFREIDEAKLCEGEDEELEKQYRLMVNSKRIMQGLSESYRYTGTDMEDGAGASLSRALRALNSVTGYDERLEQLGEQLAEIESLLSDYNHDISDYMAACEFDDEEFHQVEDRLNCINRLKDKYGHSVAEILSYAEERQQFIKKLADYDAYINQLKSEYENAYQALLKACGVLTTLRKEAAAELSDKLKQALVQLNFLTVEFETRMIQTEKPTQNGQDAAEFMISVNPGESLRPLSQVASGGELSRIMLAIKTVLAGKDEIETLIFDEIDAGISGKTAWLVSEKLHQVAKNHQVICITHLPQIAAMADTHFVIEKNSMENTTITDVKELAAEESLGELARLLGSDSFTKAAAENAAEMKRQAQAFKKQMEE